MGQNQPQAAEAAPRRDSTLPEPFTQLTNVLEFCPWPDIEPAISRLQEMDNPEAIHHIRPFLNSPEPDSYKAAVTALEKLGDDDLVDHVVSVLSEPMDRMRIVVPFLAKSDLRKHERVVGALLDLLQREDLDAFEALENPRERVLQLLGTTANDLDDDDFVDRIVSAIGQPRDRLYLIVHYLAKSRFRKHAKVVEALVDLLRYKDLDEIEEVIDPRQKVLELLGTSESPTVLPPLFAHAQSVIPAICYQAIHALTRLEFDESSEFLLTRLRELKRLSSVNDVRAGVEICTCLIRRMPLSSAKLADAIEAFCKLFEQNAKGFPEDFVRQTRATLKMVMSRIGRKYPRTGMCFIATAACGSDMAVEVRRLRSFRDEVLLEKTYGRKLVGLYERFSPRLARWIARSEGRKRFVRRFFIEPLAWVLEIRHH